MWSRHPTVNVRELYEAYDYIIVGEWLHRKVVGLLSLSYSSGAGTAGCVLANRLSEDKGVTVLVIEKGKPAFSWSSRVPLLSSNLQSDGTRTTTIPSEPQVHVNGRMMGVVMGKALGVISRINGMLYTRGLPAEDNAWSQSGRTGWSYDDLLPYFLKSECAIDRMTSKNHNFAGISKFIPVHWGRMLISGGRGVA